MRAMVLEQAGSPLVAAELPEPEPGPGQIRIRVSACGVCRTDLHVVDGELPDPKLPLVLGHQVVGTVEAAGEGSERFAAGQRVGIPWLGWTCGECRYCRSGRENLCIRARFTGYQLDGGYAEAAVADERYCLPIPDRYDDEGAAPLLCAGLIGYRALRACGDPERLGLYGFGSSAHLVCQVAAHEGRRVFAVTRAGDPRKAGLCARARRRVGRGGRGRSPSRSTRRSSSPRPASSSRVALRALAPGGAVVCAGIHMSDIPGFPYADLWEERQIRSVANLTRRDGAEFLPLAAEANVRASVTSFALDDANDALDDIRGGRLTGAAVLVVDLEEEYVTSVTFLRLREGAIGRVGSPDDCRGFRCLT